MRILIAEDDAVSCAVLTSLLSAHGECTVAKNGREAVEACSAALERGEHFDLICLDIMMPEMDGHGALTRIRDLEKEQGLLLGHGSKIIMTSALNDRGNVFRAFRQMCEGYLIKPIDKSKLIELLRKLELIEWERTGTTD